MSCLHFELNKACISDSNVLRQKLAIADSNADEVSCILGERRPEGDVQMLKWLCRNICQINVDARRHCRMASSDFLQYSPFLLSFRFSSFIIIIEKTLRNRSDKLSAVLQPLCIQSSSACQTVIYICLMLDALTSQLQNEQNLWGTGPGGQSGRPADLRRIKSVRCELWGQHEFVRTRRLARLSSVGLRLSSVGVRLWCCPQRVWGQTVFLLTRRLE